MLSSSLQEENGENLDSRLICLKKYKKTVSCNILKKRHLQIDKEKKI